VLENVDEKTVVDNQDKHHAARINKMRGQSMFLGVTHGHLQIPALKHAKKCNVKYLTEMMKFSLHPEARLQSRLYQGMVFDKWEDVKLHHNKYAKHVGLHCYNQLH
jgi:hypothetical protein